MTNWMSLKVQFGPSYYPQRPTWPCTLYVTVEGEASGRGRIEEDVNVKSASVSKHLKTYNELGPCFFLISNVKHFSFLFFEIS